MVHDQARLSEISRILARSPLTDTAAEIARYSPAHSAVLKAMQDAGQVRRLLDDARMSHLSRLAANLHSPQMAAISHAASKLRLRGHEAHLANLRGIQAVAQVQQTLQRHREIAQQAAGWISSGISGPLAERLLSTQSVIRRQLESAQWARGMVERISSQLIEQGRTEQRTSTGSILEFVRQWAEQRPIDELSDLALVGSDDAHAPTSAQLHQEAADIERAVATVPSLPWSGSSKAAKEWRELILFYLTVLGILQGVLTSAISAYESRQKDQLAQEQRLIDAERHEAQLAVAMSIDNSIKALQQHLDAASPECVVRRRDTSVRSAPGGGYILGRVYPNQPVSLTGTSGRWAKVTYSDHVDDRVVEGWILKQYLKPVGVTHGDVCQLLG